jgi:uncharacterized membrane protein YedE/YeeE
MIESIAFALLGGSLIGLAASLMLVFNGRVTGISGILNGFLKSPVKEGLWRGAFLGGLILGGIILGFIRPDFFVNESGRSIGTIIAAGFIVGFGTLMGSGCTSGHGVCGLARFSIRSLIATVTFMVVGVIAATGLKYLVRV